MKQKITTFLTFNNQAEEAAHFYVSVFKDSGIIRIQRLGNGNVISALFTLNGQQFIALNGGPSFHFSQGISLMIDCENQEEIDEYWSALTDGGVEQPCGWLTDKFGVSWQVIPSVLGKLLGDSDPGKSGRAMEALLKMKKINIAGLQAAANNLSTSAS